MKRLAWVAAIIVATAVSLWLWPRPAPKAPYRLDPTVDYSEAVRRIEALRREDGADVSPACHTRFLTHGRRTERVIVLFHGLTNCPAQFDSLGRLSFARGANVLIPRLPRHGLANRMTETLARSNAAELIAFTDRVLDAAHGLGDSVTVAGLSVGGVMAVWAAQRRADVDRTIAIAPLLGLGYAPGPLTSLVSELMRSLPNVFLWWDSKAREQLAGPRHVYPRFATRAIAATLQLGAVTLKEARRAAPASHTLVMVTVGGDVAVDNRRCSELVRSWRRAGRSVVEYEFPATLRLNHDVVDPEQVGGNPALTYPVLTRLIGP